ncbi:YbfB/YjiJ family MFS transporter [Actinomadura scrupuli]|uniref:YbfB/YjiJ family MFS transporter n=1 Tax=Actinomadura scrupuli TaxID=559629 RepID=UPI003D9874A0
MGIGRFAYTPILPLMHAQAGLSPQLGSALATANYAGYLIGALAGIAVPAMACSRAALRASLLVLTGTLALMPATHDGTAWFALRLVAGAASALVFIIAASTLLTALRAHGHQLTGWAFGGVGAGIALSGTLILALRGPGTWQQAWWLTAALSLVLTIPAWSLRTDPVSPRPPAETAEPDRDDRVGPRWFTALLAAYTLEGVGYIIAGTFLVAAIDQSAPGWVGTGAWVLVGLAALPSSALWAWLSHTWSRPTLLIAALSVQGVGIALPALLGGIAAALVSAALFGVTFLGIGTIVLAAGAHLRTPRAVAILTTGYSAGQIAGPLLVTPLLHHGYHQALLIAAAVVVLAAGTAGLLRRRFPHHLGPLPARIQAAARRTAAAEG